MNHKAGTSQYSLFQKPCFWKKFCLYRDRAKERRQKYGLDDEGPRPNRLKEKYLAAVEEAEFTHTKEPKKLDSSNIGSKMLQRMGWKEGLGLGKSNQGRTSIIEVSNSV